MDVRLSPGVHRGAVISRPDSGDRQWWRGQFWGRHDARPGGNRGAGACRAAGAALHGAHPLIRSGQGIAVDGRGSWCSLPRSYIIVPSLGTGTVLREIRSASISSETLAWRMQAARLELLI